MVEKDCTKMDYSRESIAVRAMEIINAWERRTKSEMEAPPPPGYGLDGYPLQEGKRRADAP